VRQKGLDVRCFAGLFDRNMKREYLRFAALFCFFFFSLAVLRTFGLSLQASSAINSLAIIQILIDEIGVAAILSLLFVGRPYLTAVGFALLCFLYLVSEHHMAIQGVYLRPRNFMDERIFRPELASCYVSSINWLFVCVTLGLAAFGGYLAFKYQSRRSSSTISFRSRFVSLLGGAAGLGYTGLFSVGPTAIFMLSLWYQVAVRGAISDFTPTVGSFSAYSAYPGIPTDMPPRPAMGAQKLNVIVIHLESLGDVSGRVKDRPVMTAINRLSNTGVSWSNAYGVAPYSSRAIVATQSGRYPPASSKNPFGLLSSSDYECMANDFKRAEYRTAYFTADNFSFYGSDRLKHICTYDVMRDAKTYTSIEQGYENSLGIDERTLFDAAYEWIQSSKQGFFITIQTLLPHYPYRTPYYWNNPQVSGGIMAYHDAISYVDLQLNNFLDRLEQESLLDSTLVVLKGDHGEAFEQHPKNRIHAAFLYEENLRIPFIISNPKLFPKPHASENMASLIDVAATVYDLTGVRDESPRHDGESLFEPHPRRMVFMNTTYSHDVLALRDGVFKFIWVPETKQAQLYNLKVDPLERENLVDSFPGRVRFYVNVLASWQAHTQTPGNRVGSAPNKLALLSPVRRFMSF
jgi:arylsulfatase A-like enzyme